MIDTPIEWADDTANAWWGCFKISPGCKHCYAESLSDGRLKNGLWGKDAPRSIRLEGFERSLREIARRGERQGRPRRVFIGSMMDVFEDRPDLLEPRERVFELLQELRGRIVPLLLTKRPAVAVQEYARLGWPEGAWLGVSVENQETADTRLPLAFQIPAPVFVSAEPLLESVDLADHLGTSLARWVIVGGESGPKARPCHPVWVRRIRYQCDKARVPFFFKQWGAWVPRSAGDRFGRFDLGQPKSHISLGNDGNTYRGASSRGVSTQAMSRVGKKNAGAVLDHYEHRALPVEWSP